MYGTFLGRRVFYEHMIPSVEPVPSSPVSPSPLSINNKETDPAKFLTDEHTNNGSSPAALKILSKLGKKSCRDFTGMFVRLKLCSVQLKCDWVNLFAFCHVERCYFQI
jgi:hypothetical protein